VVRIRSVRGRNVEALDAAWCSPLAFLAKNGPPLCGGRTRRLYCWEDPPTSGLPLRAAGGGLEDSAVAEEEAIDIEEDLLRLCRLAAAALTGVGTAAEVRSLLKKSSHLREISYSLVSCHIEVGKLPERVRDRSTEMIQLGESANAAWKRN
jgi:hypothetical protein